MKTLTILTTCLLSIAPFPTAGAVEPADSIPVAVNDSLTVADNEFDELDELVVVRQKKLVTSDGATLTYNVSEDPASASSNTLEILRKVPGISVDAEDNVKVNGQSSFKILMNGKEDPMLKGDIKTILKALPASSIKKIEVISEPGAKYSAEGAAGILNIVTDRSKTLSGLMASLRGWFNNSSAGGAAGLRTKLDKVMIDANVSYNNGNLWPRTSSGRGTIEALDGSLTHLTRSSNKSRYSWGYTGANLNVSWEPDTLNLFTLSVNYTNYPGKSSGSNSRSAFDKDMNLLWSVDRRFKSKSTGDSFGAQVSYQHSFNRPDNNLVVSYQLDYGNSLNITEYFNTGTEGAIIDSPYSAYKGYTKNWSHIGQIDYSNRFSSKHLFEAGGKMNLNDDGQNTRPSYGPDREEAVVDERQIVKMNQLKDIYALYSSYSGTYGKFGAKVGVRYEHTRMGARYHIGDYPDFTAHLNDIVPNAALSYNLTDASSLRLAYQMRVSRPGIWSVNPYVNTLTPGQISYGNPDLKSEKSHNIRLSYSNYEGKFGFGSEVSYRFSDNSLTDIIFMKDGILNYTYGNVGRTHQALFDFNFNWSITDNFRWSSYASCYYTNLHADSELLKQSNAGWQGNVNTSFDWTLPKSWTFGAYGGLWTPWIDLQGRGEKTGYYYGLGLSKSWLKDKALQLQLSAGNFLPPRRDNSYYQEDATVRITNRNVYSQWNVGLSLFYRFGGLKAQVRRTAANIERESASQTSSKN